MGERNVFHEHLDTCEQCREHPMALCPVGRVALEFAAIGCLRKITAPNPFAVRATDALPHDYSPVPGKAGRDGNG